MPTYHKQITIKQTNIKPTTYSYYSKYKYRQRPSRQYKLQVREDISRGEQANGSIDGLSYKCIYQQYNQIYNIKYKQTGHFWHKSDTNISRKVSQFNSIQIFLIDRWS